MKQKEFHSSGENQSPFDKEEAQQASKVRFSVKFENFNEKEESTVISTIQCLRFSYLKAFLLVPILSFATGLILLFFLYQFQVLRRIFLYSRCEFPRASHLCIVGKGGNKDIVRLRNRSHELNTFLDEQNRMPYQLKPLITFEYRFIRYYYDHDTSTVRPITLDYAMECSEILKRYGDGISDSNLYKTQVIKFGQSVINVPMKSIPALLLQEILSPLYIFLVCAAILCFWEQYTPYAASILSIGTFAVLLALFDSVNNIRSIKKMAHYTCPVEVMRTANQDDLLTVDSSHLVPGDVIAIPSNCLLPVDLILLSGTSIVNEAMLTGESVPVIKNAIPNSSEQLIFAQNSKHILHGGTKVMMLGPRKVFGLVIRTAFQTSKGGLVRDILYPRPTSFKFYRDSLWFTLGMFIMAATGFFISLKPSFENEIGSLQMIVNALNLIFTTVPPALPASMAVGVVVSVARLRKKNIYCTSPPTINACGIVDLMVFDKTGTLTEEGLEVFGYRGVLNNTNRNNNMNMNAAETCFDIFENECYSNQEEGKWWTDPAKKEAQKYNVKQLCLEAMASCHSLTYVGDALIGDPLEVKMFQATKWHQEEPSSEGAHVEGHRVLAYVVPSNPGSIESIQVHDKINSKIKVADKEDIANIQEADQRKFVEAITNNYSLGILKRFDFSSKLQCMSVLVKNFQQCSYQAFVKGSPEMIKLRCRQDSVPMDFDRILQEYTKCGYRVIALSYKSFENSQCMALSREDLESNLTFLGFLIMQNQLKPSTSTVIDELNQANIRSVMATGDNILTAISVGKNCNIIGSDVDVYIGDLKKEGSQEVLFWESYNSLDAKQRYLETPEQHEDKNVSQELRQKPTHQAQYSSTSIGPKLVEAIDILDTERNLNGAQQAKDEEDSPWKRPSSSYVLAITGNAFNMLVKDTAHHHTLLKVLFKGKIFARMTPDDKATLVTNLKKYCKTEVGMCGDGANDCAALKAASFGLSLSDAEASIAAPFTSRIQDISAVSILLREGRCALSTSFSLFKFMELYALAEFIAVVTLIFKGSNFAGNQYVWVDLMTILPLSCTMSWTGPARKLSPHLPEGSLISIPVLASMAGHAILIIIGQTYIFYLTQQQSFFHDINIIGDYLHDTWNYNSTTIWYVFMFQVMTICLALSGSKPFRQPVYTNILFTIFFALLFGMDLFLLFTDYQKVDNYFSVYYGYAPGYDSDSECCLDVWNPIPLRFRGMIAIVIIINSFCTFFYEKVVIWYLIAWIRKRKDKIQLEMQLKILAVADASKSSIS